VKALVTGATGFLGGALARRLKDDGHLVVATGRDTVRGEALAADGVRFEVAEITDVDRLVELATECDVVFHSAALSSGWGSKAIFERVNVGGTEAVVEACKRAGVPRLVHVSTTAVYHSGENRFDVREYDPLPPPRTEYARTKLMAEEVVLQAHQEGLAAVVIRPRGIFGPGDTTVFPRILRLLGSGRMKVLGDGDNRIDITYLDNVVDSLLLAAVAPDNALGKIYNITNGDPIQLWSFLADLARRLDLSPPQGRLPLWRARLIAGLMELVWTVLFLKGEPPLTRYTVDLLALSTTLDISAARQDLSYNPRISMDEGVERFLRWWKSRSSQDGEH
jgi:nucleoside-diphosphate-sugar epimerase